jgi:hypothetical protein
VGAVEEEEVAVVYDGGGSEGVEFDAILNWFLSVASLKFQCGG